MVYLLKSLINKEKKMQQRNGERGFTLIEILVVIGMIAILATIVIIAINPARQFAQGRDTQRTANVESMLNAIGQNIADNKGVFTCAAGALPVTATDIDKTGGYDLRPCIVPTYISEIPVDPKDGSISCTDATCSTGSYDTKYTVFQDSNGRVTVGAPSALNETAISAAPPAISVTR
jgi:prepilin-type N-terminal cleavage/methylation domain-containing protein